MKKRLTIADYIAANEKLVAERATLTTERDAALKSEKAAHDFARKARKDIYATLGGDMVFRHSFNDRDEDVSYMQIARRAGELVATERFFHEMKREMFGEEIIEGAPIEAGVFARDAHKILKEHGNVPHVHTKECLSPEMHESAKKLVDTIVTDIKEGVKRRRARRAFWSLVKLVAIIGIFVAVGYFGAAAIF